MEREERGEPYDDRRREGIIIEKGIERKNDDIEERNDIMIEVEERKGGGKG